MIITYQEAKKIAVSFLSQIEQEIGMSLLIVESHIRENDDGWFFPYQSKKYLETMDINKSIIGNWPIFVSKNREVPSIR